ncbi:MAG: N-6 DNA methylase [Opitutaceae bacterium]|nr:N-6 DNA methylase [Opitutaceae bacterium]
MPATPSDLPPAIADALAAFTAKPLADAARAFFKVLGYASERRIDVGSVDAFCQRFDIEGRLAHPAALRDQWKSVHLLFQLTDEELTATRSLFQDTTIQPGLLQSYLFFAIELTGKNYPRGKLTGIARQINRVFPMPVMLLIRHGDATGAPVLSIAVINRRRNKLHPDRDVLEKVTLIRDITLTEPHRGHLEILASFAVPNLVHPQKLPINNFDTLHAAWEQIFNIELLNKRFYKELANWYFWALPQVEFPADLEPDDEKRRATGLIRLLTRLIFCWFLKEKDGLIPEKLFHPANLAKLLKGFDPESETSSTYYHAILQNLFFATLNQRMGKDSKGKPYRTFATDEGFPKNRSTYDVNNLYRYEKLFAVPQEEALALFADIPFLNGGLFECLDRTEDDTNKKRYLDGFSRNPKKRPHVPDRLFFDSGETVDLSTAYGDRKRKAEKVTGLIPILNRYKFTIVENTPIDQEIALDPELLGKVFENLLASYNEETKTTARKQTGSFYTPRPIVEYMVDESLKAHLARSLTEKAGMKEADARAGLDLLFAYTEKAHAFSDAEVSALITAIDEVKILDPACGSGAFPMGVLHKLVFILGKLDPDNERWKQTQLAKLDSAPMREELERAFADNNDDYGRKLYLIENCLYGVDIQPIAIQITKLRFFISLVCDQKTNRNKKDNHGIRPLPNLETKFVAADTLVGLPIPEPDLFIKALVEPIEKEIEGCYRSHFTIQRREQKLGLQKKIKELRLKLADAIVNGLGATKNAEVTKKAKHVAEWDPFDPQSSADFFDPHWMFGQKLKDGFDIIIANPPYVVLTKNVADERKRALFLARYEVAEYKCDLYALFIEAGINFLKESGALTYIVPNPWLTQKYFSKLRSFLLRKTSVREVITIEPNVFQAAVVNNAIISTLKITPGHTTSITVSALADIAEIKFSSRLTVQQAEWTKPPAYTFATSSLSSGGMLASQIIRDSRRLDSLARVSIGCQAYNRTKHADEVVETRAFHSSSKATPEHLLEVGGSQVGRYSVRVKPDQWIRYGEWLHDYREPDWLVGPRIFVREITAHPPKRIYAAYTAAELAYYKTVLCIIPTDRTEPMCRFLCALLNSSVLSFVYPYAANKFVTDTFPRISVADLKALPVCETDPQVVHLLSRLVMILESSARLPESSAPSQFLDDLIDACVMECYFREHMAERDLLFHDTVAPHLAAYDPEASAAQQRDFLTHLHGTLNAPKSKVRNRLLRLSTDSPDLLAIITEQGKV